LIENTVRVTIRQRPRRSPRGERRPRSVTGRGHTGRQSGLSSHPEPDDRYHAAEFLRCARRITRDTGNSQNAAILRRRHLQKMGKKTARGRYSAILDAQSLFPVSSSRRGLARVIDTRCRPAVPVHGDETRVLLDPRATPARIAGMPRGHNRSGRRMGV